MSDLLTKLAVAASLLVCVALVGGCSSSSLTETQTYGRSTTVTYPPVPTAKQLDTMLVGLALGDVPDDERLAVIEDGEEFRPYLGDFQKAVDENPNAHFQVVDPVLDNRDGTISATFKFDKDGSGTDVKTAVVHFKAIDGRWKITRDDVCALLLGEANYHTDVCG